MQQKLHSKEIIDKLSYLLEIPSPTGYSFASQNDVELRYPKGIGILKVLTLNDFDVNILKKVPTKEDIKENILNIVLLKDYSVYDEAIPKIFEEFKSGNQLFIHTHNISSLEEASEFLKAIPNIIKTAYSDIPFLVIKPNIIIMAQPTAINFLNMLEYLSDFILLLMKEGHLKYTVPKDKKDFILNFDHIVPEDYVERLKMIRINYELNRMHFISNREYIEHRIENYSSSVNNYLNEIKDLKERIKNLEMSLLLGNNEEEEKIKEKLKAFLAKNTLIDSIESSIGNSSNTLVIYTNPIPMTKYDKFLLEKIINGNTYTKGIRDVLAKVNAGEADLFFGVHKIFIDIYFNGETPRVFIDFPDFYGNPHLLNHTCWGNYKDPVINLLEEKKYDVAVLMILEMLQSLNFGDSGSSRFLQSSYIKDKEGKMLYDAKTRKVTIYASDDNEDEDDNF